MFRKLRPRSIYDVFAVLALVVALGGTSAWATHEVINSSDVVNESLTGVDIANSSLTGADIFDNTIGGADITNESIGVSDIGSQQVGSDEVRNDSLLQSDIRAGAVTSDEVLDNTLGGADINESSLNLPQTPTRATFAGPPDRVFLDSGGSFTEVARKSLPAGSYAVVATANTTINNAGDVVRDVVCELRASLSTGGSAFIGGATDRRLTPNNQQTKASLSMNGGAQIGAGGGSVQLWCRVQPTLTVTVDYAQIMMIRLDGFF